MKWRSKNIDEKVYWKQVEGIDVLFSDFRNSNETEVISLMSLQLDQINAQPNKMVYGISLVKNTAYTSFIMEESKRNPLITKRGNFITTVVGLNIFQRIKLEVLNKLYPNTLRGFDNTEDALEYLIQINQNSTSLL